MPTAYYVCRKTGKKEPMGFDKKSHGLLFKLIGFLFRVVNYYSIVYLVHSIVAKFIYVNIYILD